MITEDAFVTASPARVVPQLGGDAIHLWRLPYRRAEKRAPLIALLAEYLGIDTSMIALREDEFGRPRLDGNLQFNWSHSGQYALVALARGVTPGVDIEWRRPNVGVVEIARRFFAPDEADALAACPESARDEAFFRLWCAKEAVLKALGRGLAFGLERVAFARESGDWRPFCFDAQAGDSREWQIHGVAPAPGYAGALAWRGPVRPIRAWRLD